LLEELMESISLAMADYRDGFTKCQDPEDQESVIQVVIYNHFTPHGGELNFHAFEMYHRRSFFT
jgi:hypothetical protein